MLTLTTPDGATVTGQDEIHLATVWLDHQYGKGWEKDLSPFDEHDIVWSTLEELALMRDGHLPGYTITEH